MRRKGLIYTGMPERFRIPGQMVEYTTMVSLPPAYVPLLEADVADAIAGMLPSEEEEQRILGIKKAVVKKILLAAGALLLIGGGAYLIRRKFFGKTPPKVMGDAEKRSAMVTLVDIQEYVKKVTPTAQGAARGTEVAALDRALVAISKGIVHGIDLLDDPNATSAEAYGAAHAVLSPVMKHWGNTRGMGKHVNAVKELLLKIPYVK